MELIKSLCKSLFILAIALFFTQCDRTENDVISDSEMENTAIVIENNSFTKSSQLQNLTLNLAENTSRSGYPHPLESDNGWGGGRDKWDIVDGNRSYGYWANGLAFTGGLRPYIAPCGWRNAVINFGETVRFNHILVWHHGDNHIPNTYKIQYWDGSTWVDAFSTNTGLNYVRWDMRTTSGAGSVPTENVFNIVEASKVRLSMYNCDIIHGWIYEFEVFHSIVEVEMDVKPGSDVNPINLKSKGVIPVAILTTDYFDATMVDCTTVKFGPANIGIVHDDGHLEDVDQDGDIDLILHFKTSESGITQTDTEVVLTGETYDGVNFMGTDLISVK
ncbi:hypothetical protein [Marinifilum flexuosum]|uniref:hypothetical protein n=1 Tax=Marinifilum flexuosum TaxID=1117708 RepID=UPI00249367FC|nr:hypothetical protein [Marinifilum flexuosum]